MDMIEPCAAWSNDCQGKKDYDGRLLSISTRYWPGPSGGGAMLLDMDTGQCGTVAYGPKPSAHAAIHINHGAPDEPDGYGDYTALCEAEFSGDTEEEVKAKVEAWVKEKANAIVAALRAAKL